jgi:hypothetical protein
MRTKTINILTFEELSPKAKERAIQDAQIAMGYPHADEAFASLKALAKHFNGKLVNYNIDWFDGSYSSAKFDMPDEMTVDDAEWLQERIDALGSFNPETLKGLGDCVLTGFCLDEDAIDGVRAAYKGGERDLNALMQAGFKTWLKGAQDDCKGQYEEEQFAETCEANDYEFLESGKME